MSTYIRPLPFLISQIFVSDEKSGSTNVYFRARGNLPYFQIKDFNVLKINRYITNKIVKTTLYIKIRFENHCGYVFIMKDNENVRGYGIYVVLFGLY